MRIRFDRDTMMNAITPCLGFVSSKNTITSLEGLHFITEGQDSLQLCAYDLEKGIRLFIPVTVERAGDMVLSASKFNQILRLMPKGELTLDVSENLTAKIMSEKSEYEIQSLSGKNYPCLPELGGERGFAISKRVLRKMVNQTAFAVAQNETRNALNNAYFEVKGNHIKVVTCDGNRLAIKECDCEIENRNKNQAELNFAYMVYGNSLEELMRLVEDKDELLEIVFTRKYMVFCMEDKKVFARMTEGEYIDYHRFIPQNHPIKVTLSCDMLKEALERAFFITEEKAMGQIRSVVKLKLEQEILNVNATSIAGVFHEEIPVENNGGELEIGFNCRLLREAINSCDVPMIDVALAGAHMSMVITPHTVTAEDNFLFLVLPVKMKEQI